jgi:hypothetical protein
MQCSQLDYDSYAFLKQGFMGFALPFAIHFVVRCGIRLKYKETAIRPQPHGAAHFAAQHAPKATEA